MNSICGKCGKEIELKQSNDRWEPYEVRTNIRHICNASDIEEELETTTKENKTEFPSEESGYYRKKFQIIYNRLCSRHGDYEDEATLKEWAHEEALEKLEEWREKRNELGFTNKQNSNRINIIVVGIAIILIMTLFPPIITKYGKVFSSQYSFIFFPPETYYKIDVIRLFVQWFMVVISTVGILLFQERKKSNNANP